LLPIPINRIFCKIWPIPITDSKVGYGLIEITEVYTVHTNAMLKVLVANGCEYETVADPLEQVVCEEIERFEVMKGCKVVIQQEMFSNTRSNESFICCYFDILYRLLLLYIL